MYSDKSKRICKKCKKEFIYKDEAGIPKDIEYCPVCRGDKYSISAEKLAKVIEKMLKD